MSDGVFSDMTIKYLRFISISKEVYREWVIIYSNIPETSFGLAVQLN